MFPNPASEKLNLVIPEGSSKLVISNMLGRVVYSKSLHGDETILQIDLNEMGDGVFMISLFRKDNSVLRGKFVKSSEN